LNQRPLGYEGIPAPKVNRSQATKAKRDTHFPGPVSDPNWFSSAAVPAQNPAQLLGLDENDLLAPPLDNLRSGRYDHGQRDSYVETLEGVILAPRNRDCAAQADKEQREQEVGRAERWKLALLSTPGDVG
jgi:hypothetical protein